MEFSSKASIYLPDRNAAASASTALRGRREDTVCPRTLERRGKTPSREAVGTYGQHGHVKIRARSARSSRRKGWKLASKAVLKFLGTSRPRPSSCQLHSANIWPQTKSTGNYTCPAPGIPPVLSPCGHFSGTKLP